MVERTGIELILKITHPQRSSFQAWFLYRQNTKTWMNEKQKKVVKKSDHIESYFLTHSSRPQWIQTVSNTGLSRATGVVNYILKQASHQLWIEQDEFVIRQIQTPSVRLQAEDYQWHTRGLALPKKRKLFTNQYTADIVVLSVKSLKENKKQKLKANVWDRVIPDRDMDLVRTFYEQIR